MCLVPSVSLSILWLYHLGTIRRRCRAVGISIDANFLLVADLGKEENIKKNPSNKHSHLKCFSIYKVPPGSTSVVLL